MSDDFATEVSPPKVTFDIFVGAGISIAAVVGSFFFFKQAECFIDHSPQHSLQFAISTIGFVPWLFILATLWKVRRRRGDGLLAEAEDLLLVGGVLWMELAFLGWNAFHMHFGLHGREMFYVGIFAPVVLSLLAAIHTIIRLCRSSEPLWRAAISGLLTWLAASTPSLVAWSMIWGFLPSMEVMEGWYLSHAIAFALAYAGVWMVNAARVPARSTQDQPSADAGTWRELPFDKSIRKYATIAGALCLCNLIYPAFSVDGNLPGFVYAVWLDWLGLLVPWIYWAWLVDRFRREMCIVEGEPYSRVVRRDWLALMLFLAVAGGWLSPAVAAYIPLHMILPLLLAVGVMFGLSSYLATNTASGKWLRPASIMAAGMVLPGVAPCLVTFASGYAVVFKYPVWMSVPLAAGNALVFFGLFKLRETLRLYSKCADSPPQPQMIADLEASPSATISVEEPIKSQSSVELS